MPQMSASMIRFFIILLAVTAFFVLSSIAVVWANGLKYNPETGSFQRTVIIAIEGNATEADIILNGEVVANAIPARIRGLLPGRYEVVVSQEGYKLWRQVFQLSAGQVGLIKRTVLLAENPQRTFIEDRLEVEERERLLSAGLTLVGGELYDRNQFITRFANIPVQVTRHQGWYFYQVGSELRVFYPEGPQDFLIYKAETDELVNFEIVGSWRLNIQTPEGVYLYNLRVNEPAAAAE